MVLNYAEGPNNGPPLVLLHGAVDRWQSFNPIIPNLSESWHIYALDLRGRGKSSRNSPHYKLRDLVDDSVKLLKETVKDPCTLFGHSLGGLIAIWCTVILPEQIDAVILGDTPLNVDRLIAEKDSENVIERYRGVQALCDRPVKELIQILCDRYPSWKIESIRYMAEALSRCDSDVGMYHAEGRQDEFYEGFTVDAFLQGLRCPLLFLQASPRLGGMNSDEDVEHVLTLNERIKHVLLEGVNHELGLDIGAVEPLITALSVFFESLR